MSLIEFTIIRPQRLRVSEAMRRLMRETDFMPSDLVYPFFATNEENIKTPIVSMYGVCQLSVDNILKEGKECLKLRNLIVLLFDISTYKNEKGSSGYNPNEAVQKAVSALKKECSKLIVIIDVCFCEYTNHDYHDLIADDEVHKQAAGWLKRRNT